MTTNSVNNRKKAPSAAEIRANAELHRNLSETNINTPQIHPDENLPSDDLPENEIETDLILLNDVVRFHDFEKEPLFKGYFLGAGKEIETESIPMKTWLFKNNKDGTDVLIPQWKMLEIFENQKPGLTKLFLLKSFGIKQVTEKKSYQVIAVYEVVTKVKQS